MPIVSISLTEKILEDIDKIKGTRGYFSRSEVIRDAIRGLITENEVSIQNADKVFAIIIIIVNYERHDVEHKISQLKHEFYEIVVEDTHRHVENLYCIETLFAQGSNSAIGQLIGRIRGIRGINQLKFTLVSMFQ